MSAPIKETLKWIEKADHDLGSAKVIYLHLPEYFDTIAFHCQQAVEKYLKAILFHSEINFLRSHDLIYLLELVSDKFAIDNDQFEKVSSLNNFNVQVRYPNEIIHLTKEELESAIAISEEFRGFAIKTIEIKEP